MNNKNKILNAALHYAKMGWPILPLHGIVNRRCTCGESYCNSPGKHPIGKIAPNGIKDATKDHRVITEWLEPRPHANIGLSLGRASNIVVIDIDGPIGREMLEKLLIIYEYILAPKWFVETGREDGGRHYYYTNPNGIIVPTRKGKGLEVRGDRAYVVLPPSVHHSGAIYTWKNTEGAPLDELPQCFIDFAIHGDRIFEKKLVKKGLRTNRPRITDSIINIHSLHSPPAESPAEEALVRSALEWIAERNPKALDDRDTWLRIGMALHWTTWERARLLWDEISKISKKYNPADQEKTWNSFGRRNYAGPVATLGTIFAMAQKLGWEFKPPEKPEPEEPEQVKNIISEINQKHFLIRNIGGKCMVGEMIRNPAGSGQMLSLQSSEAFKTWYANQYVSVRDNEGNAKRKPLGAYWFQHRKRRGYQGVDLVPNAAEELSNGNLNLWRGFGVEPKQGKWPLMTHHICHVLADGDQKAAEYILLWAAWAVQHPGERAEVALVLQGGKGCGKGVFLRAIVQCFGEHGIQISNQEHLVGRFNSHLRSCLLLFADEAYWAGNKKGEPVLKALITEPLLMIEQKGIDPVPWPNRLHVMMAANADWVVPASAGERRYAVFKCADTYVKGNAPEDKRKAYFDALYRELENGGLEAMLYDLLSWNLGSWHPRQVYETEGLREQKEQSLSPIEQWFVELLQEGKLPGNMSATVNRKDFALTRSLVEDAKMRVPRLNGYLSDKAMGDFLRKHGCTKGKASGSIGELRGWRFPPLAQMRADWSRRYGGWQWHDPEQQDWQ